MVATIPVLVIMKKPVIVSGDVSIDKIAKIMIDENIPCVLVIKKDNSIEKVDEEDIIKKVIIKKLSPEKVKTEDISSPKIIKVHKNTPVEEAMEIMSKNKVKELFVVDDDGKIIGMITEEDVVNVAPDIINTLESLINHLLEIVDEVLEEEKKEKKIVRIPIN
ncbi:signal transduction protein [Methanocaldococcus villosus KIN24-T80]|uniref:Signal transduction protein n=1 Tax=Methanocaldococcus villosus KIN24-T80 TaxID=1069083 RepID=N6VPD2_9EURY|nr:CBS domain-containing protein [Methanocaldococcus villosus]ENN95735.1 signal transduction protein [Methanocaldococcus villosus KIN24-T80]